MATAKEWIDAARPRTLPLAASSVIAGTTVAAAVGAFDPIKAGLLLIVGVAMQLGVNLSNDYSDGIRGTDDNRVGPLRLVGSGAATPKQVKLAAFACFGLGCLSGLGLILLTGWWWLILVGAACVAAAWFYTGGKHPYGYIGLGEVFVFIFFGLVSTSFSTLLQTGLDSLPWLPCIILAVGQGFGTSAVLVADNIRDIETDHAAGKMTLEVRLGDRWSRVLFISLVVLSVIGYTATALLTKPYGLLCLHMLLFAIPAITLVARQVKGPELGRVIKLVGQCQLVGALALFLGIWFFQPLLGG